jgi:succinate dehydrogenase assembly factor 2
MLENDLLLASFAAKFLESMTAEQVKLYDRLINLPSNDWDIFYWATGIKPTPAEFDNEIMQLLKDHVQNKDRESRIRQPNLYN